MLPFSSMNTFEGKAVMDSWSARPPPSCPPQRLSIPSGTYRSGFGSRCQAEGSLSALTAMSRMSSLPSVSAIRRSRTWLLNCRQNLQPVIQKVRNTFFPAKDERWTVRSPVSSRAASGKGLPGILGPIFSSRRLRSQGVSIPDRARRK